MRYLEPQNLFWIISHGALTAVKRYSKNNLFRWHMLIFTLQEMIYVKTKTGMGDAIAYLQ